MFLCKRFTSCNGAEEDGRKVGIGWMNKKVQASLEQISDKEIIWIMYVFIKFTT